MLFHHFHDTLGGTCTPSAYRSSAQLGEALSLATKLQGIALMVENLLPRRISESSLTIQHVIRSFVEHDSG